MLKKFIPVSLLIITCIALLQSCFAAGPVARTSTLMGTGDTLQGLKLVMTEQPGTFLMTNERLVLAAWPRGLNYAFAIFTRSGSPVDIQGLRINTLNLTVMVKGLQADGWRFMQTTELPGALYAALSSYTIEMLALSSRSLPSVYLVPLSILTPAPNFSREVLQ
jgi:hypothetical protein